MPVTLDIPFGDTTMAVELPDHTFVIPNTAMPKLPPMGDLEVIARNALQHPLESKPLRKLVKSNSRVTIAFDDPTVPAYGPVRGVVIKEILRELAAGGVAQENVSLLCANAIHRKFPHEELTVIIGDDLVKEFAPRLTCHDAEDADNLVYFGKSPSGYDVEINKAFIESDLAIYVNAAQIRGFSGGWKSICVGLSTYRSIRHHHTPDGMSMSIADNHMHMMLDEMGAHLESKCSTPIFKVDSIEANPFQTARIFAGSLRATRKAVMEIMVQQFPARRSLSEDRYDVILYGVPSWSPYAIFSHMNPILTLLSSGLGYLGGTVQALGKPGCTVIMATPCPNQWDDVHHPSYHDVWDNILSKTQDPYYITETYEDHYATHAGYIDKYRHHFGFHPIHGLLATHPLRRLKHAGKVIVAGIEDATIATHVGFTPVSTVADALEICREIHGAGFSVAYAQHPAAPTKLAM